MKVCYTNLGNLRALDISIAEDIAYIKYICTYESREKDLPILLCHVDTKEGVSYYKEYYTGNIIMVIDSPEKTYMELDINSTDKKINNVPYLALSSTDIKQVDTDFIKKFYLNDQLKKIDDIIEAIEHLNSKSKTNISNYIIKRERIVAFKLYENAYLENALYDLKRGYSYKMKRKSLTKNN